MVHGNSKYKWCFLYLSLFIRVILLTLLIISITCHINFKYACFLSRILKVPSILSRINSSCMVYLNFLSIKLLCALLSFSERRAGILSINLVRRTNLYVHSELGIEYGVELDSVIFTVVLISYSAFCVVLQFSFSNNFSSFIRNCLNYNKMAVVTSNYSISVLSNVFKKLGIFEIYSWGKLFTCQTYYLIYNTNKYFDCTPIPGANCGP